MAICLLDAIRNGDIETARKILSQKKYSSINFQHSQRDGSALFWACCRGYMDIIQLLLLHGADVNCRTSWDSTPLCAAVDNHRTDIVRLLLHRGSDINCKTSSGDTPIHLAAYRGFADIVRLLVEAGANVHSMNRKRQTPLDSALNSGHIAIANYLSIIMNLSQQGGRRTGNDSLDDCFLSLGDSSDNDNIKQVGAFSNDARASSRAILPTDNGNGYSELRSINRNDEFYINDLSVTSKNSDVYRMSFKNI